MTRPLPQTSTLLIALACGLAGTLGACGRQGDAAAAPAADSASSAMSAVTQAASASAWSAATAPASGPANSSGAPMDSISSSSAMAASESASNVAAQMKDAMPVARPAASVTTPLSRDDERFVQDVAQASLYDVQASTLAGDHADNDDLKAFAAKLVADDHMAAADLTALAKARGVRLPDGLAFTKKAQYGLLEHLQAKNFDTRYIQDVGVDDQRNAIALFERVSARTRDADLKAWIARMLPTLRDRYAMAQQIARTVKG